MTTIKISKDMRDKFRAKTKGSNDNERMKFLLGEDKFSKTFLTKPEIEKLIDEKIESYSGY